MNAVVRGDQSATGKALQDLGEERGRNLEALGDRSGAYVARLYWTRGMLQREQCVDHGQNSDRLSPC